MRNPVKYARSESDEGFLSLGFLLQISSQAKQHNDTHDVKKWTYTKTHKPLGHPVNHTPVPADRKDHPTPPALTAGGALLYWIPTCTYLMYHGV